MRYVILIALVLLGCGKDAAPGIECTWKDEPADVLEFGTLEKIKCPAGQFLESVKPSYKPGTEEVISFQVQCARKVQSCKAVGG